MVSSVTKKKKTVWKKVTINFFAQFSCKIINYHLFPPPKNWKRACLHLVSSPDSTDPLMRKNGPVNQVRFFGLVHAIATM